MPVLYFFCWLALIVGAGWLAFPISRRVFATALPDAGLAVGRVLFLAIWTLLAFYAGQIGVPVAWSAAFYLALALGGLALWRRDRVVLRETLRSRRRAIRTVEAVFVVVFLGFFLLRGFWSDTSGTNGEKGMDGALIASLTRAQRLPPPNPYAAGAPMQSYYYFGHLEAALLTRASFTTTRWGYNWMCATLPALCFGALFSLGAALTGRLKGGAFVTVAVLMGGTLQPVYQWLHADAGWRDRLLGLDAFGISRVIPFTINEFPWFTFNQADLHAHYFDFPLALALMALAWTLYRAKSPGAALLAALILGAQIMTNTWDFPAYALLIGLGIACLTGNARGRQTTENDESPHVPRAAENERRLEPAASVRNGSPRKGNVRGKSARNKSVGGESVGGESVGGESVCGLEAVAEGAPRQLVSRADARRSVSPSPREVPVASGDLSPFVAPKLWTRLLLAVGVALGALVLAAPFLLGVKSAATPPQLLPQPASPLREWLLLWGPIVLGWWGFSALVVSRKTAPGRGALLAAGALVVAIALRGEWETSSRVVLPLLIASALLALWGALSLRENARFVCLLALCGLFALVWSETTWAGFLGDANHAGFDDYKRQDTVFKFGLQAWMLWGTASAAGLWLALSGQTRRVRWAAAWLALPLVAVMLAGDVAFTLFRVRAPDMIRAWQEGARDDVWRFDAWDGWAHLAPPEQAAARWLELNAAPGQNIVEAEKRENSDFSEFPRYAHATGIPTVIGPVAHTFYWSPANAPMGRGADGRAAKSAAEWDEVYRRKADARAIYSPIDIQTRGQLLRRYNVKYLVWGQLERAEYGDNVVVYLASSLDIAAQFGAPDDPHRVIVFQAQ